AGPAGCAAHRARRRRHRHRRRHRPGAARRARRNRHLARRRSGTRRAHRHHQQRESPACDHQGRGFWKSIHAQALPRGAGSTREQVMATPRVGITMGDAAGIGPEIIVKALGVPSVYEWCRPVVIGEARRMRKAAQIAGSRAAIHTVADPSHAGQRPGEIDVIDLPLVPEDLPFGKLSGAAGNAAYHFIARAVELAKTRQIDAICTAPLNKEALHAGGHIYPGHTELLAKLSGTPEVSMMLMTPKMRVIHVTTHI